EVVLFLKGEPAELPEAAVGFEAHWSRFGGSAVVWEQLVVGRKMAREGIDVVFDPAYALPEGAGVPGVVTIHDLSFELLPGEFAPVERWRRRVVARRAARRARRVLADTAHVAKLLQQLYGVDGRRLGIVPLGVDLRRFSAEPDPADGAVLDALGVRRPYLLWTGAVFERRLPRLVLEAFGRLRSTELTLQLVLAGPNRLRNPRRLDAWIDELGLGDAVLPLGWVEEEALAPLYRNAAVGIYLSRHEGFGLPPLECLACGTPVVVSAGLGLDDSWPGYPFRCPDPSVEEVAATIVRALGGGREIVRRSAPGVLAGLSWEAASRLLVAELERAVSS
ncbi:MAG TPA: glycosyltransferase, partial [Acidobacteria bacterium]|nr:glycosyltransferase [Acidobacteriota bacterium]